MDGQALDLSKTKWEDSKKPMFNVTLVTGRHNKKMKGKESELLHVLQMEYDVKDFYPPEGPKPFGLQAHENDMFN